MREIVRVCTLAAASSPAACHLSIRRAHCRPHRTGPARDALEAELLGQVLLPLGSMVRRDDGLSLDHEIRTQMKALLASDDQANPPTAHGANFFFYRTPAPP